MLFSYDLTSSPVLSRFLAAGFGLLTVLGPQVQAQVILKAQPVEAVEDEVKKAKPAVHEKQDLNASWATQKEARAMTLSVPAPRGQIVDRHGIPFAQNRAASYLALVMPYMDTASDAQVTAFARSTIGKVNQVLGKTWSLSDERVLLHYKHRRWLPLVFSVEEGLNVEITPDMEEKLKPLLGGSLVIQPAYLRHYPQGSTACHIIGYTGKTRPLPTGPIVDGDPVFEEMEGREGIETAFDSDLKGQSGIVNVLFSPDGKRLSEDVRRAPSPGRNVVLSIDYNFQKYAENALKKHTTGGAMVIMDVTNGDILAMASNPGFDLNEFVPGIRQKRYDELTKDPHLPLYPRSFRGEYPPASTFKIVTALGALDSGKVDAKTQYDCPNALEIGDRVFKNWNKDGEGSMNVVSAIKRSCNTWFYRAALESGADYITNMAMRLGFGERTGIPLKAEGEGFVPTNSYLLQHRGHKMLPGDLANIAIGQGMVLATPLQVCQCMAGLGDGKRIPQPRLVLQIQDLGDRVVMAYEPKDRRRIDLNPDQRQTVISGMVAVVNGGGGTGHAAAIKQAEIAGKTGTAQWRISKDQNLAWFTGFLPAGKPMFAFAVVYEGEPGEDISGGKKAAPIVHEVFTNIFEKAPADDPMLLAMKDVAKATPVSEEASEKSSSVQTVRPAQAAPPPPPRRKVSAASSNGSLAAKHSHSMNIQLAIVCDFAADYQGKLCIQGAFDTLCAQTFPVVHPQCSIAVRAIFQAEDAGKHEFVIRCVDPDGKECLPPMPAQLDVTFPSSFIPFVSRNIVYTLQRLKFERQGMYRWLVQHQDDTLASIPLRVTLFDDRRSATGPAG